MALQMGERIAVTLAGEGTWAVPAEAVAHDRAIYQAREAIRCSEATACSDLYASVFAAEYAFALSNLALLRSWAAYHMDAATLRTFKPCA